MNQTKKLDSGSRSLRRRRLGTGIATAAIALAVGAVVAIPALGSPGVSAPQAPASAAYDDYGLRHPNPFAQSSRDDYGLRHPNP